MLHNYAVDTSIPHTHTHTHNRKEFLEESLSTHRGVEVKLDEFLTS